MDNPHRSFRKRGQKETGVADVVRRGRLRWFGHLERKSVDDWVSACRGLVVEGARGGAGRRHGNSV